MSFKCHKSILHFTFLLLHKNHIEVYRFEYAFKHIDILKSIFQK